MRNANTQIGLIYGRLTVLSVYRDRDNGNRLTCLCVCTCGTRKTYRETDLRRGKTVTCGCERNKPKHGQRHTRTWQSWMAMRRRCLDTKYEQYPNYGGRGIIVCARWADAQGGYLAFVADVGQRPIGKTLDRIDVNGNYEPGNVRWATQSEQERNKRAHGKGESDAAEQSYWDEQERLAELNVDGYATSC